MLFRSAVSIGTVILPDLTGLANNKKWEEFNDMLIQSLKIMTLISIPVTAYSLVTGRELISLLYRGKAFDDTSVALTLGVFNFHICGLEFIALNRIISPAFYAQKNTKPPALAGIISFISNILLVLILVHPMGGNGIALALSIASFINTVFLFIFMRKMEAMNVKKVVISTILYALKMIVYSVIAALPCYFLRPILLNTFAGHGKLIGYGLPVAILAVVFAVVGILELIITRDDMVKAIIGKLENRITYEKIYK